MQKNDENKPKKQFIIVDCIFIILAVIVFIFMITYQQIKYPVNLKLDQDQYYQIQNQSVSIDNTEEEIKQLYQQTFDEKQEKSNNLQENSIEQVENFLPVQENFDKFQDELSKYNISFKESISDFQFETSTNLQYQFSQISQNYPIGSIIPFIQFYQTFGTSKNEDNINSNGKNLIDLITTSGVKEYNGILFLPLIGGKHVQFDSWTYPGLKTFCEVMGTDFNSNNCSVPNTYQCVLRQDNYKDILIYNGGYKEYSYFYQNGYRQLNINYNLYHLDKDQDATLKIEDTNGDIIHNDNSTFYVVSGITANSTVVPAPGCQNEYKKNIKQVNYYPIKQYDINSYSKDYAVTGQDNNTNFSGQEVCRSISKQGLVYDGRVISNYDQSQSARWVPEKFYKQDDKIVADNTQYNCISDHINCIFLLIVGYTM